MLEIIKLAISALLAFLGRNKPDTTLADVSASNAQATTELKNERSVNAELIEAADARADVDASLMHGDSGPANAVNTDPAAPVNSSSHAHFRD